MTKIPVLFVICVDALAEFAPLKGQGMVSKRAGDFEIEMTADVGQYIPPFHALVSKRGHPIALVGPDGASIIGKSQADEDELIAGLRAAYGLPQQNTEEVA